VLIGLVGCGAASQDPDPAAPDDPMGAIMMTSTGSSGAGGPGALTTSGAGGASAAGASGTGAQVMGEAGTSPIDAGRSDGAKPAGSAADAAAIDAAPHVVVPCDSAKVGVWENITPPEVLGAPDFQAKKGYGVNAFVIDRSNTANVTLGSDHLGIHRTTDCGATWKRVNTGQNGAALDGGTQWAMAIDPVDPNVIYTVSGYGTMGVFKTTNAGVDWQQTLAPQYAHVFIYDGFTAQVRVDPTEHLHVVITPHFTCQAGHSETCFLETVDGGSTWTVVENTPSSGEGSRITLVDHDTWFSGLGSGGLFRTSDAGKSWKRVTDAQSYAYEVLHRPGGKYYLPVAFGLAQSDDGIGWMTLSNSPGAQVVTTSSTRIYVSTGGFCVAAHNEAFNPISSAAIDSPTVWTVDKSYSSNWGGGDLQFDADHHMLYTSSCLGGFWRVRVE
jgi:hypothetical protein